MDGVGKRGMIANPPSAEYWRQRNREIARVMDDEANALAAQLNAAHTSVDSRIKAVLDVARSQLGVQGGTKYRSATNSKPRDPFCVSFVVWCLKQVYTEEPLPIYSPTFCSASLRCWGRRRGLIRTEPQQGDILLRLRHRGGLCSHVGLVEHVLDEERLLVIDANGTLGVGERNVVRRRRWSIVYYDSLFLRWRGE